jgi:O-antigen ligase
MKAVAAHPPVAAHPRETSRSRGDSRSRTRRRDFILPLGAVLTLFVALILYGAEQKMASLVIAAAMSVSAAVALATSGPRSVPWPAAAALLMIWIYGFSTLAGDLGRAIPSLAILSAAVAAWSVGHVAARTRVSMDTAWAGLVWVGLAYSMWTFVSYIALIMNSAGAISIAAGFSSPVSAAIVFGALTLVGCARVTHIIKRIDAEGLARSEVLDRVLRDGLGGLLLTGFSATCLVLSNSAAGLLMCAGASVALLWWDTRSILTRDHRSLWVRVLERAAPLIAILLIGGGIMLGWMADETVSSAAAGLGDDPRLQRVAAYLAAWRESPFFGHGFGSVEAVRDRSMTLANAIALQAPGDTQNVVLRWLVETGATGLALGVALIATPAIFVIRSLGNRKAPRTFARLSVVLGVFLLAHGATDSSLDLPAIFLLLAFVTGLSTGIARPAPKRTN